MKKLLTILATSLVIASTLLAQAAGETTDTGTIRIGISQLMAHPALDDIAQGIVDALEEDGIMADVDIQNANGDVSTRDSNGPGPGERVR